MNQYLPQLDATPQLKHHKHMQTSIIIGLMITMPVVIGVLSGRFIRGKASFFVAGALPWFGLLAGLLYNEFYVPHQGGATMWPFAQFFGGFMVATIGLVSCTACKVLRQVDGQ